MRKECVKRDERESALKCSQMGLGVVFLWLVILNGKKIKTRFLSENISSFTIFYSTLLFVHISRGVLILLFLNIQSWG